MEGNGRNKWENREKGREKGGFTGYRKKGTEKSIHEREKGGGTVSGKCVMVEKWEKHGEEIKKGGIGGELGESGTKRWMIRIREK